jgi:anaerobic ribonucleoside-triphosphate reductase activating protein
MKIKGLITEDFVNYKKVSMTIMFPHCTFKCGAEHCQNTPLAKSKTYDIDIDETIEKYLNNPITDAVVMQGLEPFDSWSDLLLFIEKFRAKSQDDIVIYTGYCKEEIANKIDILKRYDNIVVKYGRYTPGHEKHYDEVLGVNLASDNQYAEVIS